MLRFHNFAKILIKFLPHPVLLFFLVAIFCSLATEFVLAESVDSSIQSGISNYRQQNFEDAELDFSKAQKQQPDNPELNYNLANSHYKNGKYKEALQSYSNANAKENESLPVLKQNSIYNSGNALYRLGKLEESIAAYKKVLELNHKDSDAKFNLEFVREKLKEKKQQDQKQNQSQDENSESNQNPKQNPKPDNKNNDDRQESAQQENPQSSNPEEQGKEAQPDSVPSSNEQSEPNPIEQAQDPENSISKEQAEQWLSGLDEDLKKFSQKQANRKDGKAPHSVKNW